MASSEQQAPSATPAELAFIEDFALTLERLGLVRMTGRVVGWLLICDPPEQTFGQIAGTLQASKGSISTALKFLSTSGWANKSSKPGDRSDYYSIRPGVIPDLVKQQSAQYGAFTEVTGRGLDMLADASEERRGRLQDMHEFFTWLSKELPALMERWDSEQGRA